MLHSEALTVKRQAVYVGGTYTFYAEMQQEYEPPNNRMRRFTGTVVIVLVDYGTDGESSRSFQVRAHDGTTMFVWEEELNGWDRDLGQYFHDDGTYGPDRDRSFMGNERS